MREYKILKENKKSNKVLVAWKTNLSVFKDGYEYSVHTKTIDNDLIWGHYFMDKKSAKRYFKNAIMED